MIDFTQIVSDVAFMSVSYAILTMLGLPLCLLLRGVRLALLLAPIVGCAIAAGAVPLLYLAGLSMKTIFFNFVAVAAINAIVVLLYWLNRRRHGQEANKHRAELRELLVVLAFWLVGAFMLILPAWTGGLQFTCFQGNIHDQFTYMDIGVCYAHEPSSRVLNAGRDDLLRDPLLIEGQRFMFKRPAVASLFATLGQILPSEMYRTFYAYLVSFQAMSILSLSVLAVNVLGTRGLRPTILAALVSLAATVGFWGQYVMDINAWSQVVALPLLSALVTLVIVKLSGDSRPETTTNGVAGHPQGAGRDCAYFTVLAVLVFGSIYLYPSELLLIVGSLLFSATIARLAGCRLNSVAAVTAALVTGMATCLFYWQGTVGYALEEVFGRNRGAVDWWQHFHKFYFGQCWPYSHPQQITMSSLVDGSAGQFGLYFLTPFSTFTEAAKLLSRSFMALWIFGLVACAAKAFADRLEQKRLMLMLVGFFMFGVAAVLFIAGHFWTAGKVMSYLAPFLMMSVCLPILCARRTAGLPYAVPALLLVVVQILFGAYRPVAAANPTGIHYDGAFYPSIQDPNWKRNTDWRIDKLSDSLSGCSSIKIDIADPLVQHWAMYFLASKGRDYCPTGPVIKALCVASVLGQAPVVPGRHCMLSLEAGVTDPCGSPGSIRRLVLRHVH